MYKDIDINEIEKLKKDQEMMSLKRAPTNIKVRRIEISVIRSVLVNQIKTFWKMNLNKRL